MTLSFQHFKCMFCILGIFSKTGKTEVSHRIKMMTRWPNETVPCLVCRCHSIDTCRKPDLFSNRVWRNCSRQTYSKCACCRHHWCKLLRSESVEPNIQSALVGISESTRNVAINTDYDAIEKNSALSLLPNIVRWYFWITLPRRLLIGL